MPPEGTGRDLFTVRPSWASVPTSVRDRLTDLVGSPAIGSTDLHGGMSPGPAARLTLADGRRVFVKGGSAIVSSRSHRLHVQEAEVLGGLAPTVPAARLLGVVRTHEWIVLATTWIDGPSTGAPWTSPAVRAVAEACAQIATHPAPPLTLRCADRYAGLDGWASLASGGPGAGVGSWKTRDARDARHGWIAGDAWEARHAERFAELATGWRDWIGGDSLAHHDVRGDNAVIDRRTGEATLVDWAFGGRGAPWLDRAWLAIDVVAAGHVGGPGRAVDEAMRLLATAPSEASRFVVAVAGMWRFNGTLPPHPGMSTHRRWQLDRARALRPLLDAVRTTIR
jgi:hypothetical protein